MLTSQSTGCRRMRMVIKGGEGGLEIVCKVFQLLGRCVGELRKRNGSQVAWLVRDESKRCETQFRDQSIELRKDVRSSLRASQDHHWPKIPRPRLSSNVSVIPRIPHQYQSPGV